MPIWLHLAAAYAGRVVGFLAACLAASYAMWAAAGLVRLDLEKAGNLVRIPVVLLSAVVMFSSAVVGIRAGNWLVLRLPARCPRCGGRARGRGCKVVTYTCENCGYQQEQRTERG
jgi:hypothetical protein